MKKTTMISFRSENQTDRKKKLKELGITGKDISLINLKKNSILALHKDTIKQMEKVVGHYSGMYMNSPIYGKNDTKIKEYIKEIEESTENIMNQIGTVSPISTWIAFTLQRVHLQPVYYHEAIKLFPDSSKHEEVTYNRSKYIDDKRKKAVGQIKGAIEFSLLQDYRTRLLNEDKEAIKEVQKVLFYVENFIGGNHIDSLLMGSPIMYEFIKAINELIEFYNNIVPNGHFPRINEYLRTHSLFGYEVNFVEFEIKEKTDSEIKKSDLSAADWATIFFYTVYAKINPKHGELKQLKKTFYEENKIENTFTNFSNTFEKVKTEIHGQNAKGEPVKFYSPKKIEKILPFIKNDKKALQKAKNHIVGIPTLIKDREKISY